MSTRVITPKAILSYPHLFEPTKNKADDDGGEKYSCALVFTEGADLSELKAAVLEAAEARWGTKAEAMLRSGKLKSSLRTDVEDKGYPEDAIAFLNARSKAQPGVVSVYAGPDGKAQRITDPKQIYAGCFVVASLTAFPYEREGNRGVGFGLNNIQKISDGPRIDGRKAAEDEFKPDLSAKPADISDLE